VRAPDAAYLRPERLRAAEPASGYVLGAPDLAVEVISPNDRPGEIAEKVATWLGYSTRLVVVVYPAERRVRIHRPGYPLQDLTVADHLDGGDVLPGWRLSLARLFA